MTNFNKLSLAKIKNILLKKGYKIDKKPSKSFGEDVKNFFYLSLLSFFLIGFFGVLPKVKSLTSNIFSKAEIVENN